MIRIGPTVTSRVFLTEHFLEHTCELRTAAAGFPEWIITVTVVGRDAHRRAQRHRQSEGETELSCAFHWDFLGV